MSDPQGWIGDLIALLAVGLTIYGKIARVHKEQVKMTQELGQKVDRAQRTAEKAIRLSKERYTYDQRERQFRARGKRWYDRI